MGTRHSEHDLRRLWSPRQEENAARYDDVPSNAPPGAKLPSGGALPGFSVEEALSLRIAASCATKARWPAVGRAPPPARHVFGVRYGVRSRSPAARRRSAGSPTRRRGVLVGPAGSSGRQRRHAGCPGTPHRRHVTQRETPACRAAAQQGPDSGRRRWRGPTPPRRTTGTASPLWHRCGQRYP